MRSVRRALRKACTQKGVRLKRRALKKACAQKFLDFAVTDQTAGALGFERPSFQFSISEDPVQKDTILLNYCIDDIERFAAEIRLKHFPEEINDRRKSSEPRAIDFVNIFQKFKLAFNLLVSLLRILPRSNFMDFFFPGSSGRVHGESQCT